MLAQSRTQISLLQRLQEISLMNVKKLSKPELEVHEALQSHEWLTISGKAIKSIEPAVSNDRRICLSCDRIEWDYWNGEEENWKLDDSGLARRAIDEYILKIFDRVEAIRKQGNE